MIGFDVDEKLKLLREDPLMKKILPPEGVDLLYGREADAYLDAKDSERFLVTVSSHNNLRIHAIDRFPDKEMLERFYCKGESNQYVRNAGIDRDANYLAVKGSARVNRIGRQGALNLVEDMYSHSLIRMAAGNAFELSSEKGYVVGPGGVAMDRVLFIKADGNEFHMFSNAIFRKDGKRLTKPDEMVYQGTKYVYNSMVKDVLPNLTGVLAYRDLSGAMEFSREDLKLIKDNVKEGQVFPMATKIGFMRAVTRTKALRVKREVGQDRSKTMDTFGKN